MRHDLRGTGPTSSASSVLFGASECLDHVIIFSEAVLYWHVKSFAAYYHRSRTHLSLAKDSPESQEVQPRELGRIVAIAQVGGLHHRYERRAA